MPGYDRTGPVGAGARTGWGRGPCGRPADGTRPVEEPYQDEGARWYGRRPGGGRGFGGAGWGRGFGGGGWGRRRGFEMGRRTIDDPSGGDVTPRRRQAFLRQRIEELTAELDRMNQLLSEDSREGAQDEA